MVAVGFKCPDGVAIKAEACLKQCRMGRRCVSRSTLQVSVDRKWDGVPHVTQLLNGTMMEYLKIKHDYYIDPQDRAFALLGSTHHKLLEEQTPSIHSLLQRTGC